MGKISYISLIFILQNIFAVRSIYIINAYDVYNMENINAVVNTTLLLQCPEKNNIQWIFLNSSRSTEGKLLKEDSNIYTLSQIRAQDKGIYACLTNGSNIVKKYNLIVFEPPHFVKNKRRWVMKRVGDNVRLTCKAEGNPAPHNISWYFHERSPFAKRQPKDIKTYKWSLTLENAEADDSGNYTCQVCNIIGCTNFTILLDLVYSCSFKFDIEDDQPKNVTVMEYQTAILGCTKPYGAAVVTTQWSRVYNYTGQNDKKTNRTILQESGGNAEPKKYKIINATHEDEGWYSCNVTTNLGTTTSITHLRVVL